MSAPWAMSTMVNAPTGTGSLSDEVLGPMRKRLDSRRPRTSASASDLPGRRALPAALPRASANQDLGIADGPSQSDLQRWFSASDLHASSSAAPSRRPATVGSQRSVSLTHQLGTRLVPSKYDACIKPSLYRVQQADERILRHLRGATPLSKEAPWTSPWLRPFEAAVDARPQTTYGATLCMPRHGQSHVKRGPGRLPDLSPADLVVRAQRHPAFPRQLK